MSDDERGPEGPSDEGTSERQGRRGGRRHHRSRHKAGSGSGHRRRQERVLHTRISEQLSDDIRRLADDMRVPVSNLVRNVLEEVFTVVDHVSEDVGGFFEEVLDEAEAVRERIRNRTEARRTSGRTRGQGASGTRAGSSGRSRPLDPEEELQRDEAAESASPAGKAEEARADAFADVLAWQPIVVNKATSCADCGVELERGARGFLGVSDSDSARVIVCSECAGAR